MLHAQYSEHLKPCPFCRGKAGIWDGILKGGYITMCEKCGCMTPEEQTPQAALAKWNRRKKIHSKKKKGAEGNGKV